MPSHRLVIWGSKRSLYLLLEFSWSNLPGFSVVWQQFSLIAKPGFSFFADWTNTPGNAAAAPWEGPVLLHSWEVELLLLPESAGRLAGFSGGSVCFPFGNLKSLFSLWLLKVNSWQKGVRKDALSPQPSSWSPGCGDGPVRRSGRTCR